MRRAIARIAFNYLAYRMGPDFVLGGAFDGIRNFIRHGLKSEPTEVPPVVSEVRLPFRIPGPDDQRPVVHFVAVARGHSEHQNLLGLVCLFGMLTHTVMLAYEYSAPWPKPYAHLFNPKTKRVQPWLPGVPLKPDLAAP